jgi:hypothetical protein
MRLFDGERYIKAPISKQTHTADFNRGIMPATTTVAMPDGRMQDLERAIAFLLERDKEREAAIVTREPPREKQFWE